jgi:hypothetical protein
VTTLALAWYYTDQTKYADYGARLVQAFFLDDTTGMYPNLDYAQMGDRLGLMEWKDVYYLLDAITLLEMSGYLNSFQILKMQRWCAQLGRWYIRSPKASKKLNYDAMNRLNYNFFVGIFGSNIIQSPRAILRSDYNIPVELRTR